MTLGFDLYLLARQKNAKLVDQEVLVNNDLSGIKESYIRFIDEMVQHISKANIYYRADLLNSIRKHYLTLEKIGIEWVNLTWYAENNTTAVNQLGILEGSNNDNINKSNNIFKYCKRLVYPDGVINGNVCVEVSVKALESYISSVLHNEIELFLDSSTITSLVSGRVVCIDFFDKKAWFIMPDESLFSGFYAAKYLYFLIGISFVLLVILRSKNDMIKKDNNHERVIQSVTFKKDLFWQLYLFHDSGNYFNFVTQNAIDAVINYFDDSICSLNLSISTRINEDVINYKINLYVAMRLLLNFLENTISQIQQNGKITIQVSFLDKYVQFVYYDNRYISHFDDATQKNDLSCFELTHDEIMYYMDNYQVKITKESCKYEGSKAIFSLPVENHCESNNIVSIFEMDEVEEEL